MIQTLDAFDVVRVRAGNAGPLTLDGTNTWVVGRDPAWVVDPGPALPEHLDAVAAVVADRGGAGGIALTHHHLDHTEAVEPLRERLGGVPVGPGPLDVVPVPGHSDDHVALVWRDVCCTGDAVLGEGSVFVAGDMAGYLDGLRALRERPLRLLCPGHGPPVPDAAARLDAYLAHRLDRVWHDAPAALRAASRLTMHAHLRKLAAEGRLPAGMRAPARGDVPAI